MDYNLGLTCVLLSLFLWTVAWAVSQQWTPGNRVRGNTDTQTDFDSSLYRKPLRVVATRLAILAAAQQLGLAWPAVTGAGVTGGFPSIGVLFLAGVSVLVANHALRDAALSLIGILFVGVSILWAQGTWFHGTLAFVPWLEPRTFADQWLTLSVVACGLATLRHVAARIPTWDN